ncbi:MAG: hypothetical protein CL819_01290 [Croceicoccus sp.]|nr:hypothetical protein [Croceicoccus sp.]
MLARPDVQAEIAKQAKLAAKAAAEEQAETARVAAERAKMDEVDRLKAEKADAEAKAAAAVAEKANAERERDLAQVLVTDQVQLAEPTALDFLRFKATQIVSADPSVTMQAAVKTVLDQNPYLVKAAGTPAPAAAGTAAQPPAEPPTRPSTAPATKPTTTPAAPKPNEGVDVMAMSRQEYEEYKRQQHSLH